MMGLNQRLLQALEKMGFNTPTEVQKETIPIALSGKDIIVRSKTGSGKTAAFLVPIINSIGKDDLNAALIIAPTRELAIQVSSVAEKMVKESELSIVTVYGGSSMNLQISRIRRKVNIIIGTPGRIIDLMKQGELSLNKVKFLVLDEADTMLDMGFIEDIAFIISKLPLNRQTMLFSATIPSGIINIANKYMKNPLKITVGKEEEITVNTITHLYTIADGNKRLPTLLAYINYYQPKKAIIFVGTQHGADRIYWALKKNGFDVTVIHGGLTQKRREYSLSDFRRGTRFLVATNVAARGIDINDITDVINVDVGENPDIYVHRVGRSARMGAEGRAFSIFPRRDSYLVSDIERSANIKMTKIELDISKYISTTSVEEVDPSQLLMRGNLHGSATYENRQRRPFKDSYNGSNYHSNFSSGRRYNRFNSSKRNGRFRTRGNYSGDKGFA